MIIGSLWGMGVGIGWFIGFLFGALLGKNIFYQYTND